MNARTDAADLACYRCGASLAELPLPLSRRDQCPACARDLHACRMCRHYDPRVAKQCREDDAEEVTDKEKANFCDWFEPAAGRFDGAGLSAEQRAKREFESLFGGGAVDDEPDDLARAAEDLFR